MRAVVRDLRAEETCDIEDQEGTLVAKVYTCPDGDGVMTVDEAEIQMEGLGITRVTEWRREGDAWTCEVEPCGGSEN